MPLYSMKTKHEMTLRIYFSEQLEIHSKYRYALALLVLKVTGKSKMVMQLLLMLPARVNIVKLLSSNTLKLSTECEDVKQLARMNN